MLEEGLEASGANALRDGGDMRGAAWAMVGLDSPNPRLRSEAIDAMLALTRTLRSERARFAPRPASA